MEKKKIKFNKPLIAAITLALIVLIVGLSVVSNAGEDENRTLKSVTISELEGVGNIPATYIDYLDGLNLFTIQLVYSDLSTTSMTSLDCFDGDRTWMTSEYKDKKDKDGNITRTYTFKFYNYREAKDENLVLAKEHEVKFPAEVSFNKIDKLGDKFDVTETKNWSLVRLEPVESGTYQLSEDNNSRIGLYLLDGKNVVQYSCNSPIFLDKNNKYILLIKYDLTDYVKNTSKENVMVIKNDESDESKEQSNVIVENDNSNQ